MAQQGRIPTVDKRLAAAGIMMGAAVGAWAGTKARSYAARERDTRLIDWERARTIAINMNRGNALTTVERSRLDAYYRALVERCVPVVAAYTGTDLPDSVERTFAFDRVDWINANLTAFQGLFAPLEALNAQKGESSSVISILWGSQSSGRQRGTRRAPRLSRAPGARPIRHGATRPRAHGRREVVLRRAQHCRGRAVTGTSL